MAGPFRNLRNAGAFRKTQPQGSRTPMPFETTTRVPLNGARFPVTPDLTALTGVTGPEQKLCFFDTETTGLSGGAGSLIFQAGLGTLEDGMLVVRQYFIAHPGEEPRMLAVLADHFRKHPQVVTYNGKSFDMPLLMGRYVLNRMPEPEVQTLDLLHAARAVWRHRLRSFRLGEVETAVLGVRRHDDLPGALVPSVYRDFLAGRDRGRIRAVLRHNLQDIVSLAFLLQRLASACEKRNHPSVCLALGRRLLQQKEFDPGRSVLDRVFTGGTPPEITEARLLMARAWKRSGHHREAAQAWQQATDTLEAGVELAKYHEHRQKDPAEALRITEELLNRSDLTPHRRRALLHRRRRLLNKLDRN